MRSEPTSPSRSAAWLLLVGAILAEVTGTMGLRATVEHAGWMALTVAGYVVSFALFGMVLRAGFPVGVAYGIWGAAGVALAGVLGVVLFGERLGATAVAGLVLICLGVALVETGSPRRQEAPQ